MTRQTDYSAWIGRREQRTDVISIPKVAMLSASLDRDDHWQAGRSLPPLWHWIYFNPIEPLSEAGHDGHPKKGRFLPPVDLPRRMWAGGQLVFHRPLLIAEAVQRVSTIVDITAKSGRSGRLVFVKVEHQITGDQGGHITEYQDLVYREAPDGATATTTRPSSASDGQQTADRQAAPSAGQRQPLQRRSTALTPDAVLLFRYSALTFNSHRIHYDRHYCLNEEHYPGLVVHGPLTATLLANLCQDTHPGKPMKTFDYRGLSPLFDGRTIGLHVQWDDNQAHLWAESDSAQTAMRANATF